MYSQLQQVQVYSNLIRSGQALTCCHLLDSPNISSDAARVERCEQTVCQMGGNVGMAKISHRRLCSCTKASSFLGNIVNLFRGGIGQTFSCPWLPLHEWLKWCQGTIPFCWGPLSWEDVVMDSWVCQCWYMPLEQLSNGGVLSWASHSFPWSLPVREKLDFYNWSLCEGHWL